MQQYPFGWGIDISDHPYPIPGPETLFDLIPDRLERIYS